MFSVRGVLCAPLRFDARFAGAVLGLRDALALFEVVFVAEMQPLLPVLAPYSRVRI